ncbi:MAG: 2,3-bisphosphoglycerate-independent phosphoglycerate mutase [Bacteroidia bacterium]|jgi:2,3-bisphosphoglycerate-independent phosphoglycerate mutase|nr:2,3-bisphosphoglycerate-independent phosphoglycerate mutase [Bacteroidia bacterium]
MAKKTALIILDGWGNGKPYDGNAIYQAHTPNFDSIVKQYPGTSLKCSGLDVGLPEGQMGNSEVGHMNLGAGRVVYQQLVLINKAFDENWVATNSTLLEAFEYANTNQKSVHLIGLVSDGGVHSSLNHLLKLSALVSEKTKEHYIHAFTDGRDTDPKSGEGFLKTLENQLKNSKGKLATIVGRYYAMDRDKRWERVKIAYDALVNNRGEFTDNWHNLLLERYASGETDEFIKPIIITEGGKPVAKIQEGDVVICFNFRTDRGREITQVLTQENFPDFDMQKLALHYVTLTEYDKSFKDIKVVFPDIDLQQTLGEVLEKHNKKQVRIAETEKYPHVTFFFSGGRENPFIGESRCLAPSPKVATYDLQPEMSANEVCGYAIESMAKGEADFICVNFANPDMVGHTGVIPAEIIAVQKVDECLGKIIDAALENGYTLLVTADHGNGEYMKNEMDGTPNTAHTTNDVPLIMVNGTNHRLKPGRLADIAPTILELMQIEQPKEMTGSSLLC